MKKPTPRKASKAKAKPVASAPAKPTDTISSLRGKLTDARIEADRYRDAFHSKCRETRRLQVTVEALQQALIDERASPPLSDIPF
ncbi:hypothetical protein [uncultured Nitratireductor sp.]|uniref:hypothetical protein n=1 Tax=uncultured Nitratireductor sp. TaxID=520953 RepID=UPI0025D1DF37|nr:hypothetical protein [uncultured Nitratireductor sp.]